MGVLGFVKFVALLIFIVSTFETSLMADPRTRTAAHICNSSTALSSTIYGDNFVSTMTNLSTLVNQNGFGTTVAGEGANAVFGLGQCYDDLNSSECTLCFSQIRSVLPTCYRIGGRLFLDGCFGRYENFSFFEQSIDDLSVNNCSYGKINSSDPVKFGETVRKVAENVSLKAGENNGFAVESSVGWSDFPVYALAQCWDSLSKKACSSCLQVAASSIALCSPATDGRSLNAGCYMRYSTELFWNSNYNTDHNPKGKHRHLWIILFSTIIGVVLLIGIFLWKGKYWLFRLYRIYMKDLHGSGLSSVLSQSKLFEYRDLKRATNSFDTSNKVGQGSFGAVYKGTLPNGKEVAVKRLFLNIRQWIDQFVNEVELVNQVRHKNLVKLIGCSVDGPESLLVFEYCPNKSLDHFLFDEKQAKILDWKKRIDIIEGVAEGLSYLHRESVIRIIHRDVKASNILLSDNFKPKITDFGLARSFTEDQTHLSTGIAGTLGYMAPEYAIHGHLTEKADVYSFGVLTFEVVTGQRCTDGFGTKTGKNLLAKVWSNYKSKTMERMIDKSIYKEATKDEILHVVRVGLLCTQATPSYRPTMAKVVELLRNQRYQDDGSPIAPPFLDFDTAGDSPGDEALHVISVDSAPSRSGSSGSLIYGR